MQIAFSESMVGMAGSVHLQIVWAHPDHVAQGVCTRSKHNLRRIGIAVLGESVRAILCE